MPADEVAPAIERVLKLYLKLRQNRDERFIDCVRRLGVEPFKEAIYEAA